MSQHRHPVITLKRKVIEMKRSVIAALMIVGSFSAAYAGGTSYQGDISTSAVVGDVITVTGIKGESTVSIGSVDIADGAKVKGDITTRVAAGMVTTISGIDGKSDVSIGSVRIGK